MTPMGKSRCVRQWTLGFQCSPWGSSQGLSRCISLLSSMYFVLFLPGFSKTTQMPCAWCLCSHSSLQVEWFSPFSVSHDLLSSLLLKILPYFTYYFHMSFYTSYCIVIISVFERRICFLAYGWYSITVLWINQWLKMGKSWNFIRTDCFLFFTSWIIRKHWLFCGLFKVAILVCTGRK